MKILKYVNQLIGLCLGMMLWACHVHADDFHTPPTITWDSSNPKFGSVNALTFKAKVTASHVAIPVEAWMRWEKQGRIGVAMTLEKGQFVYTMDAAVVKELEEGKYKIQMQAQDRRGNNTGWVKQGDFTIVRTAPVITWDSSNPTFGSNNTLTFKANIKSPVEGVAIDRTRIRWKSTDHSGVAMTGANGEYGYTLDAQTVRALPEGKHTIEMMSVDVLGNGTGWLRLGDVTIVRTAPIITWDSSNPAFGNREPLTFKANIKSSIPGIAIVKTRIRWKSTDQNGVEMTGANGEYGYTLNEATVRALPEGKHTIEMMGVDAAGNDTGWLRQGDVTIVRTAPVITWDSSNPTLGARESLTFKANIKSAAKDSAVRKPRIRWKSTDQDGVAMYGANGEYSYTLDEATVWELSDGKHTIEIKAADIYGNDTGWIRQGDVTIARALPVITWNSSNPRFGNREPLTFKTTIKSPVEGVSIESAGLRMGRPDGPYREVSGENGQYSFTFDSAEVGALPQGKHLMEIRVMDAIGNQTGWVKQGDVTIVRTAPVITWDSSNPILGSNKLFTFKANIKSPVEGVPIDKARIRWKSTDQNGVAMSGANGAYYYMLNGRHEMLPEGKHTIEMMGVDAAGNDTGWLRQGDVTIVRALPVITWDSSNPRLGGNNPLTFKATIKSPVEGVAIDKARIRWKSTDRNGVEMTGANGEYGYTLDAATVRALSDGKHTIEMMGVDAAGNDTGWLKQGDVTIVRTAPVITWNGSNPKLGGSTPLYFQAYIASSIVNIPIDKARIRWKSTDQNGVAMTGANGMYGYTMDAQTVSALPEGKHTIEMMGVDALGNDTGWLMQREVTIVRTAPVITWSSLNPRVGNKDPLTFKVNIKSPVDGVAIDKARIRWKRTDHNGVAMTGANGEYGYTLDAATVRALSEGKHTIEMMGVDAAGNDTGWLRQGDVTIVRAAPVITWDSSNPIFGGKNDLVFQANIKSSAEGVLIHDVSIRWKDARNYRLMNGTDGHYSSRMSVSDLSEGKHAIEIKVRDTLGNETGWVEVGDVTIVRAAPVITWDSSNPTLGGNNSLTFKATIKSPVEGVAINEVGIRWRGTESYTFMKGEDGHYSYVMNARNLSEGTHTIEIRVRDAIGNETGWVKQSDVRIIRTAPVITWDSSNPTFGNRDPLTFKAKIKSPVEGIAIAKTRIRWKSTDQNGVDMTGANGEYDYTLDEATVSALPEGKHTIEMMGVDVLGNDTGWIRQGDVRIVRNTIKISWSNSNPTLGGSNPLYFRAHITSSFVDIPINEVGIRWRGTETYALMNTSNGYYVHRMDIRNLSEGTHTIEIRAWDAIGNDTGWLKQSDVTIVRIAPVITWDSSNPRLGASNPLTFKANIKSPVEGVAIDKARIRWKSTDQNGVAMTGTNGAYGYTLDAQTVSALPAGTHTIEMMGVDVLGNETGWIRQGDVSILRSVPVITWDSSNPIFGNREPLTFKANIKSTIMGVAIEKARIKFGKEDQNGAAMTGANGEYYYTIDARNLRLYPEAKYSIEIMGVDALGNDTGWFRQRDVTIVRTAPVIIWDSSNPRLGGNNPLTFKATIKSPVEGVAIDKARIRWKSTDQNGVEMTGANDEYGYTLNEATVRALPEGKHTIEMMGVDVLGNDTGWRRQGDVTIVRTVPKVIWDANNAQYTQENRITLNASVTDVCCGITAVSMRFAEVPNLIVPMKKQSGDVFSVLLDSVSMNLPEGVIHVEIKADNEAGNSTDWVLSGQFTVLQRNSDHKVIEKLKLEKSVLPEGPVLPGTTLHYTLKFTNMNAEPLRELIINGDYSMEHGVIKNAQCGDMKSAAGLSCCVVSDEKGTCIAPFVENPERLEWHFNGELPSGGVGTVTYELQVHP